MASPVMPGVVGTRRVLKLMMPPTFCGPKRTAPPPRTTSTVSTLARLTGANDSCGWPYGATDIGMPSSKTVLRGE
ncbi:hypothetical protein D3C72_1500580 [compost metagenome]